MSGYKYSECMWQMCKLHAVDTLVVTRDCFTAIKNKDGPGGGAQYANPDLVKTARVGATHMVVAVS